MNIKKRITVALAVAVTVLAFAQRIEAGEAYRTINIFYYDLPDEGTFAGFPIDVYGGFTEEQVAYFIFANLFEHYDTAPLPFIAEGTRLLGVKIENGRLTVDVSREIITHGAGTAYQTALVNTVLENARQLDGVLEVSLLIEGKAEYLPDGLNVQRLRLG